MTANFRPELEAALSAALEAGAYLREAYEQFVPIPDAPATISTVADRTSQDLLLKSLSKAFPDDAFVAEENIPVLDGLRRTGPRCWVIDPIDGTRGFAKKNGEFSLMIGLVVDGLPVVGVVYEPILYRMTYATLGGGCWTRTGEADPVRNRCRPVDRLRESKLVVSHLTRGVPSPIVEAIRPVEIRETYSAGVKLAMVARGESDMYIIDPANPYCDWDVCAGQILVSESGGIVTRYDGSPVGYPGPTPKHRTGLLAAAGTIHPLALSALHRNA
jgi:3'(2'), 5'-bisphosphate nucleotidase